MSENDNSAVILFVDDNVALSHSIECLLQMEGYQVMLAFDGAEAIQCLETTHPLPDLIISDIMMPNIDGFQFYEELRKRPEWLDIPFIFLTALDQVEHLERGYSMGADNYIVKPFDNDYLLAVVRGRTLRQKQMRERARIRDQQFSKLQHDLATMVAHELRTPLVSITMVADLLAHEMELLSSDQVREMLDVMQSGQARLHRLVEQMVMYVEMKSGVLDQTVREMRRPRLLHDVLADAVRYTQRMDYRQRNIPIRLAENNPEVIVFCDANTLRQALGEVMLNAMAFSTPQDVIEVAQWSADGWTSISIRDRGPGIPEEAQARVFEPFFQVNREWQEQQGIGIGLTLVKEIVEMHGGKVDLQSQRGVGTDVRVSLPIHSDNNRQ